jgi:hypothetical protein
MGNQAISNQEQDKQKQRRPAGQKRNLGHGIDTENENSDQEQKEVGIYQSDSPVLCKFDMTINIFAIYV